MVKGKLAALSEAAVVSRLRGMGVAPISIREAGVSTGLDREIVLPGLTRGVRLKDLAIMSRQMATMIAAGLSLLRSLTVVADQTTNKTLASTLRLVQRDVETGSSFSESLQKHPLVFPRLMIYLVKAGEVGGFLDRALDSIAKNFESDVKLRATIRSAMTYPVTVLIIAIAAVFAMLIFIVPVFQGMFAQFGGELPLPTQVLVTLSGNMIWILPVFVVVVLVTAIWWQRNKHLDSVRKVVDPIKLRIPVFGPLFTKVAVARFCRNLATMMSAGVPILQSLSIVAETSSNWVLEQSIRRVQDSVRTGKPLAVQLAEEPMIPAMVVQMVAVGEDSGSLETMLAKAADFYDEEVQSTAESLTSLIEPLMIVVIGAIIGGMIVALYMPIFTIFDQIE